MREMGCSIFVGMAGRTTQQGMMKEINRTSNRKFMGTIIAEASPPGTGMTRDVRWRSAKRLLLIFSFLGLVSLNVLTLASDQVHAVSYNAIKAILARVVPVAEASRFLSSSPTAKRQNDVAGATKKITQEKTVLLASKKALETKHLALEKSFKEIEATHTALKRTSETRAAAVMTTSQRLAVRSLTNASRNVSSVFAETIPIVGTGIILAVTAWDVHDACETLKDINKLNSVFDHPQEDEVKVCGMKVPTKQEVLAKARANANAVYQSAAGALKRNGVEIAP